ncbi:LptF/LptG family permease [Porphyromonas canoris]|uniref:Membrane protein n=1 Tax=Porphyromonas canoris TaxID=36875 RepID=A0ABR4XN44_9PORP|nr:LptF/LptG family permease [Porphyromonas canoris]KGN93379.1 membrane protein [Porphyromonas canoris]
MAKFWSKIGLTRLDRYIIKQFLGTFLFIISLIMAIIVVIDIQEKISEFSNPELTLREIVFNYYMAFIPYYANLLAPLFIFLSVIFFTSKLANNSEIIAMQSSGMSLKRIMKPYMISATVLAFATFLLSSYIVPKLNVVRIEFQNRYIDDKKNVHGSNLQAEVAPGVLAFFSSFDIINNSGGFFSLEKFEGKTLVSRLTAQMVTYDSLYHWTLTDYMIRDFEGLYEKVSTGTAKDTVIPITPADLVMSDEDSEQLTTATLGRYIDRQRDRGLGSIQRFQIEYHRRFASILAAFILTVIGATLSLRKVKGGMGLNIAIGLALTFTYILLFTFFSTYSASGAIPPALGAWLPNIIFIPVAFFLYMRAPR